MTELAHYFWNPFNTKKTLKRQQIACIAALKGNDRKIVVYIVFMYGIGQDIWWNNNSIIGKDRKVFDINWQSIFSITLSVTRLFYRTTSSFNFPPSSKGCLKMRNDSWPSNRVKATIRARSISRLTVFRNKDWTNSKKKSLVLTSILL